MSSPRVKASAKYDRANTLQVSLKLNLHTDEDIISRLGEVKNKQGYIKRLIREDIERTRENNLQVLQRWFEDRRKGEK